MEAQQTDLEVLVVEGLLGCSASPIMGDSEISILLNKRGMNPLFDRWGSWGLEHI